MEQPASTTSLPVAASALMRSGLCRSVFLLAPLLVLMPILALVLALVLTAGSAVAQDLGGSSAGQLEKRFEEPLQPQAVPTPLEIPSQAATQAPEGAESVRFVLQRLELVGATAFAEDELAALYAQRVGKEISLAEIYDIAAEITREYGDAGFLLSRAIIPPQTIDDGVVRIQVIEGYVSEVVIEGLEGRPDLLAHYTQAITASRPLDAQTLERYLMLANDLPGVRFKSVLSPAEDQFGAALLTLTADTTPWQGAVSLDNRGSETSGPWQMLIEGTANDLFGRLEKTTLRYATVPDDFDELQYYQLSHQQILNGEGLRLSLDLAYTDSEPGGSLLRQLDVVTESSSASATLSYPVIRSRQRNLTLSAGFGWRDSSTKQLSLTTADDQLYVLRLSALFDQADTFGGGGVNLVAATLNQGLDAFDADVTSRLNADPDFTSFQLQLRRTQYLDSQWSADFRLSGQLSADSLPSSEQFGLGGESNVRGYEPSEFTGDEALAASAELIFRPGQQNGLDGQYYAFYDAGKIWRERTIAIEKKTQLLRSAGLGLRANLPNNISLNLEAAHGFDRDIENDKPGWELYGRLKWLL